MLNCYVQLIDIPKIQSPKVNVKVSIDYYRIVNFMFQIHQFHTDFILDVRKGLHVAIMESPAAVVAHVMYVHGVPLSNAGRLLQTASHLLFLIEKLDILTVDYVAPMTLIILNPS